MRTQVLPTDPSKRAAWVMSIHTDSIKEQYFSRWTGPEGSSAVVIRKTDLESGPGDEVTTTLVAKLIGAPVIEGQKLEGKEMKLDFATHKMRINTFRQGVNVGTAMDSKRMGANLKSIGRQKLTDYIKELYEELHGTTACGARGVGNEFVHLPPSWPGYPNALRAPDSNHLFIGSVGDKAKNTLVSGDKLTGDTLKKLATKARKQLGGVQDGKPVRMSKTRLNGKEAWVLVTMPEGVEDIRSDTGTTGWFEAQRQLIQVMGKQAEIFQGGAGLLHGVLVDETDALAKFNDYGASSNLLAMRSLLCGANALAVAHGTKGMQDGMSLELDEDSDDRGNEKVITFKLTCGVDRTTYTPTNGAAAQDYALIAVDTSYTLAPGSTI